MKRGLVFSLILGFFLVVSLSLVIAEVNCTETDDGADYYEQGIRIWNCTEGSNCGEKTDSCTDNMTLLEYFCEGDNSGGEDEYNCRYGCKNGACVEAICSAIYLNLCWDKPLCIKAGGYWYNYGCHKEPQVTNQGNSNQPENSQSNEDNESDSESQGLGQTIRKRVRAGVYTNAQGEQIRVSELAQNRTRLKTANIEAETELEIEEEKDNLNKTKLKAVLSNGRKAEIKIMPDVASATALTRLRLKVCSEENNCTIQLKELAQNKNQNKSRLAYEIQTQRHFRLYGLFKKKAQVQAQVDAETGEIIAIKKPWWAFLATEPEEEITITEEE